MTHPAPAKTDLTAWLTKKEAADLLQVSFKTLEKYVTGGKLQAGKRQQAGKPDAAVYHPDDVARLRQERFPGLAPFVLPEDSANGSRTALAPAGAFGFVALAEALREGFAKFAKPAPVRLTERFFLTIKEASQLSGLPQTYLREAVREGKLGGLKTGRGWKIRRKDLEGL